MTRPAGAAADPDEAESRTPSLVVGVGTGRGVSSDEVIGLIERTLREAGLSLRCVAELATVEAKAGEPGLLAAADRLRLPLRTFTAAVLAAVEVPNPTDATRAAMGTPSVSEAAALAAAGEYGMLIVPKTKSASPDGSPAMATAAVARRRRAGALPAAGGVPEKDGSAVAAAVPDATPGAGSSSGAVADGGGGPGAASAATQNQHSKENQ
ncbi:cobalamin biosynthesis protein [Streptomyces bathyalis]|uniref:cobalamin biosynthesis protein n=1 Tax=Streptomyces bathyalis TaxID=2710756 RepID=UPI003CCCAE24